MFFKRIRHTVFFLSFPLVSGAQSPAIDSLKNLVRHSPQDTGRVNHLNALTDKIWQTGAYDTAMVYARQAVALAQKLDFKRGLVTAHINTALIYWKLGEYPKALEQDFRALQLNEKLDNPRATARALNSIGLIYFNQKNYTEALRKYETSLAIRKKLNDTQGVAGSLNNIGEVYKAQGNSSKAFEYFEAALQTNRSTGNRNWESINLNNMAQVYQYEAQQSVGKSKEDNYNKAIGYYTAALRIRQETGDRQGIALSGIGLGVVHTQLGHYRVAEQYFNEALQMAGNIGYREGVKEACFGQMRLDSLRGNWKGAFEHHVLYIRYRDSLINEESTRQSVRAEMNFDFEKKQETARLEQEKKDALAAQEKHQQKIIIVAVSAVLAIVLVLALVILRSLRQNQEKNRIITAQKALVEQQKHMVDEKQREITDSINYAERIQRSFLASDQLLRQHLGEYFVFFAPRDIVSGDFYWAAPLSNGNFLLATADSTGHGVPGAIMSILNISCLEKSVEERGLLEPAAILDHTRALIIDRLKKDGSAEGGKDGMDCSLVCFDSTRSELVYAAAHNPVWIVHPAGADGDTRLVELPPDKMPVGKHDRDHVPFSQHRVAVKPGDMVYTLTDGLPDQFGGDRGKKFMYKTLKQLLLSVAHLPVQEQQEKIARAFFEWKGDLEQVDDVCIIGIKLLHTEQPAPSHAVDEEMCASSV